MSKGSLSEKLSKRLKNLDETDPAAREFIRMFVETKRELRHQSAFVHQLGEKLSNAMEAEKARREQVRQVVEEAEELRSLLRAEAILQQSLKDANAKIQSELDELKLLYDESRRLLEAQQDDRRRYEEAISVAGSLMEYHAAECEKALSRNRAQEILLKEAQRIIALLKMSVAKRQSKWLSF